MSASPLRKALLRGALVALLGGLVGAVAVMWLGHLGLVGILTGVFAGLALVPTFFVETAAARGPRSWPRHLGASGAAALLGATGVALAFLQAIYTKNLHAYGFGEALAQLQWVLGYYQRHPERPLVTYGSVAVPIVALTLLRLRGVGVVGQLGGTILALCALSLPALLLLDVVPRGDARFAAFMTAGCGVLLPALAIAADALERRLWPPEDAAPS